VEIIENRKNKKIALEEEKREAEIGDGMEEDGEDIEEVDSDEWNEDEEDPIPRTDCLFCLHHSSTIEKNAIHMSTEHSFFIPDLEYLVDLPGLFEYLGAKVKYLN
jgi:pre-60S factor REI1